MAPRGWASRDGGPYWRPPQQGSSRFRGLPSLSPRFRSRLLATSVYGPSLSPGWDPRGWGEGGRPVLASAAARQRSRPGHPTSSSPVSLSPLSGSSPAVPLPTTSDEHFRRAGSPGDGSTRTSVRGTRARAAVAFQIPRPLPVLSLVSLSRRPTRTSVRGTRARAAVAFRILVLPPPQVRGRLSVTSTFAGLGPEEVGSR